MNYYTRAKLKERNYQNIINNHDNKQIENILHLHYGKVVCACPKCKNNILEHQSYYICENCSMKIPKEISSKYINNRMVKELCSKGKISVKKNHLKYEIYLNDKFNIMLQIKKVNN